MSSSGYQVLCARHRSGLALKESDSLPKLRTRHLHFRRNEQPPRSAPPSPRLHVLPSMPQRPTWPQSYQTAISGSSTPTHSSKVLPSGFTHLLTVISKILGIFKVLLKTVLLFEAVLLFETVLLFEPVLVGALLPCSDRPSSTDDELSGGNLKVSAAPGFPGASFLWEAFANFGLIACSSGAFSTYDKSNPLEMDRGSRKLYEPH